MKLKTTKFEQAIAYQPPTEFSNDGGDDWKYSFRKGDAVIMCKKLTLITTYTSEICIVVEICNGWITIKDSNGMLYLVHPTDITYIGYKTECIVTTDSEILLNL